MRPVIRYQSQFVLSQKLQTSLEVSKPGTACETCDASPFARWPNTETRMKNETAIGIASRSVSFRGANSGVTDCAMP